VEHPKFEGHVMSNQDEYQISVRLKFRYCPGVYYKSAIFATFGLPRPWP